jgi:PAS domain S-box-containing protein
VGDSFDQLLASTGDCIKVLDAEGRLVRINDAGCRMMEVRDAAELLGTRWVDWWDVAGRAAAEGALREGLAGGTPLAYEAEARTRAGTPKWWEVVVTPLRMVGGVTGGVLVISRDITERKRSESLLKGQNLALELVASGVPLEQVLECLARIIEEQSGGTAVASIFLVDADGLRLRVGAAPSLPAEYNAAVDGISIREGLGTCADAAARGAVTVTTDICAAPSWKGLAHLPAGLGLHAAWSMPIVASTGRVLGTIGTYFRELRGPTEREKRVVEGLCRTAAIAIERRAAEEAARQEQARTELMVRGANVGMWYCTLPFAELVWDVRVKDHFHLPPSAHVTIETFYERLHPDDRERTRVAIGGSIAQGTAYDIDYRTVSPDGASIKWIRAIGRAFYDAEGRPTRFDGITIDVTDRKAIEEDLRESESRQRAAAEALGRHVEALATLNSIGLALASPMDIEALVQKATDAGTRLTRASFGAFFYNLVNEQGESYTLYTLSGVPRSAFEKFPMPRNTQVFAPTFTGEGVVRSDDITRDARYGKNSPHRGMPEGHLPVRSYLAVPVMARTGEVIGGLFFGHPDPGVFGEEAERYAVGIAAQAATALDNARLYAGLRRSEERYKLASRATNDAIWDWDLEKDHVSWNPAVGTRFGYSEAVSGTNSRWWLERIHPDDQERVSRGIDEVIGSRAGAQWESEYRFRRSDGTYADVYDRGTLLRDAGGRPLRMVGAMLDVSERKEAERERHQLLESERSARAAAERAGRLKDEFLATLSHELRTPLNAILGWAQLLRQRRDEAQVQRGVEVIERNARVQTQLISDLLDISRITSGKMRLDVQRVDLPSVIHAALESMRPGAESKGVRIQSVIEPLAEAVHGDPARLQQVVWNLVSNAVKFTPKGGRVQVVLARVNSHVEITVSDTGQGIDAAFLPYVFERFRQADASSSREYAGLGLGLALVKQLVELHGGRVRAASGGKDQGSTFVVELPLAIIHQAAPQEPRVHPHAADAPAPVASTELRGVRVLVVDDEPDALDMVRRILEGYGAVVDVVASADEGLGALERSGYDALVSDIGMPRKDGYQFVSELRRRGHKVPAAALTAFARSEDRTRALLAGYQSHVTKPVEAAELLATIVALTGRAPGARA